MFNLYLPKFYYTRYNHVYPCCATGLHFYFVFLNLVEPWKGIVLNAKLNFNKLNNFCLQETKKKNKSCFIWCYFADCDENPLLKNRNIKLPKARSTCLNSAEIFFFKCTTLSCFNTWTSLVIMALCAHLNVFFFCTWQKTAIAWMTAWDFCVLLLLLSAFFKEKY